MCETLYRPDVPVAQQIEQVLHNASTWRDAIDTMLVTQQLDPNTVIKLQYASTHCELVRENSALALLQHVHVEGNEAPLLDGHGHGQPTHC